MRERELRAFVAVVEAGRMDLAAKELGYSQPAISYQIKGLEQSLGVKLFVRAAQGAQLTEEGRLAFPIIKTILSLLENLRATSDLCHSLSVGGERAGTRASVCASLNTPPVAEKSQRKLTSA